MARGHERAGYGEDSLYKILKLEDNPTTRAQLVVLLQHFVSFNGVMTLHDVADILQDISKVRINPADIHKALRTIPGDTNKERVLKFANQVQREVSADAMHTAEAKVLTEVQKKDHLREAMTPSPNRRRG